MQIRKLTTYLTLTACAFCLGLVFYAGAKAAEPLKRVKYTSHNLAKKPVAVVGGSDEDIAYTARNFVATDETEVCIFCHTPHGAAVPTPLWNKTLPTQTFLLYTASKTLSSAAKASQLSATSESLLCLACHDGKSAVNVLHNSGVQNRPNIGGDDPYVADLEMMAPGKVSLQDAPGLLPGDLHYANLGGTEVNPLAGNDLTNDHPIGFSYTAAYADRTTRLWDISVPLSKNIRFFGATKRVECSSCHNPHVAYGWIAQTPTYTLAGGTATWGDPEHKPYLVMSNVGSAMCLACHNK